MLLLMLMPKRPPNEKLGKSLKDEDRFMRRHGGWGPRLIFQYFQAVTDLLNRLRDILAKREH
jgi:hypothetical protein